jgi:hypothetical protein
MVLGAIDSMRRTPTLDPSPQGGGRRKPWRLGSFDTLPLVGREAEQGLASAKSVAKQGGGVGVSTRSELGEVFQ